VQKGSLTVGLDPSWNIWHRVTLNNWVEF